MKTLMIILLFISSMSYAQISDFNATDFTRADNIATLNKGASLSNLSVLAHNLTSKLSTDVEKFRAIHSWVCDNIAGDIIESDMIIQKRKQLKNDSLALIKWNNHYKKIAFKKLLKHKTTMCTGYAYLIKELCFLANIECEIIDGYVRTVDSNINNLETVNHSWNAVKLQNKWYLCDATWSSGYPDYYNYFVKSYNDGYFLADPNLFAKSHYPLHKKWFLNDTLENTKFIAGPLIYQKAFEHKIIPISPNTLKVTVHKNTEIDFTFKSLKPLTTDKVSLVHLSSHNENKLQIDDLKIEDRLLTFKHLFKHKGIQDIHLKINGDIVATYTFNVIKFYKKSI